MSQGTIASPLEILQGNGFKPSSDLNYCTDSGIEYFIGWKKDKALVVALLHGEDIWLIRKPELREMSLTARTHGISHITLLTNYGIELHSRLEKPETIGFNKIIKVVR